MELRHLGDDYDIVKRVLLRSLNPNSGWGIIPMFTHQWPEDQVSVYADYLGGTVLTTEIVDGATDRRGYFAAAASAGDVFLDPNTGVPERNVSQQDLPKYVRMRELCEMVGRRPNRLTVVYDQSIANGADASEVETRKLARLNECGVVGFAYAAQVSFLILSGSRAIIGQAKAAIEFSDIPAWRLTS